MITFRYRIRPSRKQVATLDRHVETCRQLYNRLLGELNRASEGNRVLSKTSAQAFLPAWKAGDFPELGEVYSRVAHMVVYQLYNNLAGLAAKKGRGQKVGRLRYKGRGWYASLNYNQSGFTIDQERGTIRLAKVGVVRATFHRELPPGATVKGIVVKKTNPGKWFACLQCAEQPRAGDAVECDLATRVRKSLTEGGRAVGIDLGITHFAADSDGQFAENPQYLDRSLAKIKVLQRKLSRKKRGSRRRAKARFALAKRHEKAANQRRDFLHKLSRYYVRKYDVVCAEDLSVSGMLAEKRAIPGNGRMKTLHRHVVDAGWRVFLDMLAYKAQSAGKLAIFVDPCGTSQECAACGAIVPKALWDRVHHCPRCGFTTDRDINASLMIKKRGTGRAPTPVELASLLRFAGATAGEEAGTLINSPYIELS
jgi:putative transposase